MLIMQLREETLNILHYWLEQLIAKGKAYGYYPAPAKSYLIVSVSYKEKAQELFSDLGVKVVTHQQMLGGVIGDAIGKEMFVRAKVVKWLQDVHQLSRFAVTQPQASYAALTKSLQCEWNYLQRVVPDCVAFFGDLEHSLATQFFPTLFGTEVTPIERDLFSLPARMGGFGIADPSQTVKDALYVSRKATEMIVQAIKGNVSYETDTHNENVFAVRAEAKAERAKMNQAKYNDIFE